MKRSAWTLAGTTSILLIVPLLHPFVLHAREASAAAPATVVAGPQRGHEKHGKESKHDERAVEHERDRVVVRERVVEREPGRAVERTRGRASWDDGDHCRVVVREYYDRHDLPPGLARRRALPPGLQKQLRERGHLPPGLERHLVVLPVQLERTLPPLPPHHVRRFCGDDLLVIDVRANTVVSIFAGIVIHR